MVGTILDGYYCVETGQVHSHYEVTSSGIQQVLITHCGTVFPDSLTSLSSLPTSLVVPKTLLPSSQSSIQSNKRKKRRKSLLSPTSTCPHQPTTIQQLVTSNKQQQQQQYVTAMGSIVATVSFHNPYGYLPGQLFGLLPFQLFRMIICLVGLALYSIVYLRHLVSAKDVFS